MFTKVLLWAVRTYFGGKQKSWLIVSVLAFAIRLLKKTTGRKETVDLSNVKPGQRLVIEHLKTSHKAQLKGGLKPKRGSRRTELARWKSQQNDN